jgi:zinc transport system substrate-binding protein
MTRAILMPLALLLALALPTGAATPPDAEPAAPLDVLVSILPHASLVERLGGEAVAVEVLIGPGESPHTFDPTPRELARLSGVDLWLRTGIALEEPLLPRLRSVASGLEVVALQDGLERIGATARGHDHAHGAACSASCGSQEGDPHVWLSARNTAVQVRTMAAALAAQLPHQAADIAARADTLLADLAALDTDLARLLAPHAGQTVLVFHPAFGYFARDYGLVQKAVETGGLAPSPRHVAALLREAEEAGVGTIFIQPQASDDAARILARQAGLRVAVLDPLARDHLANLRRIGTTIAAGLEPAP